MKYLIVLIQVIGGFTSQLFGNVPEAKRVITYAASCGTTKYEDLPDEIADRIREFF